MNELAEKWKRGMVIFLSDLPLLGSLFLAEFIVWRIVSRRRKEEAARRKERAARLKRIKLVQQQAVKTLIELPVETLGDPQCKT